MKKFTPFWALLTALLFGACANDTNINPGRLVAHATYGSTPTCTGGTTDGSICAETALSSDGTLTAAGAVVAGSTLTIVSQTVGLDFSTFRIFDSRATPLTVAAGDDDDLTYYEGTFGTNAATLETVDCGGLADTPQKAVFTFVIPSTYPAGATISLRANVGMRTTVADQSATLDLSCYVADYVNADGTMSGDLITTTAQNVNSTTFADKTLVLDDDATGYVLDAGSVIECLMTVLCDDDGNAAGGITVVINRLDLVVSA